MDRLKRDLQLRILRDAFFADFAGVCKVKSKNKKTFKSPKSLCVPRIPRPEVYIPLRDTPQVQFDPVPRGVREGLEAVSTAARASLVSEPFKILAQDDVLWRAPLSALENAFEAGDYDPDGKVQKYVDPRHTEAWPELSTYDKYGKLLTHIKVMSVDFFHMCHRDAELFANNFTYGGADSLVHYLYHNPYEHGLKYGEKEPPKNWWEEVFTDPVIQRILWNTYADGMMRGATTIDFWEILIGGSMNLEQAGGFREIMLNNAIQELVGQGYLKTNYPHY
jgi:hypothetical protein